MPRPIGNPKQQWKPLDNKATRYYGMYRSRHFAEWMADPQKKGWLVLSGIRKNRVFLLKHSAGKGIEYSVQSSLVPKIKK